jgi:hypothetical protein
MQRDYALDRRRSIATAPTIPVPSSASVEGSGVSATTSYQMKGSFPFQ